MLQVVDIRTPVIGPISLSVAAGDCAAILGPSGSGKSLFLRAIADLDPNEGAARLNHWHRERMPAYEWRRQVAMVPSESGWWADIVADHFENAADARDCLEALGMADALDWEVARLSTGEKQRVAIARALVNDPGALLLDEPTAALDADSARRVESLIMEQCRRGMVVVLVTHDHALAERLASRRYVMVRGMLRAAESA